MSLINQSNKSLLCIKIQSIKVKKILLTHGPKIPEVTFKIINKYKIKSNFNQVLLDFMVLCSAVLKGGGGPPKVSYMTDSSQHILFTSEKPSLAFTYDTMLGLHSAWRIRRARSEVSHSSVWI